MPGAAQGHRAGSGSRRSHLRLSRGLQRHSGLFRLQGLRMRTLWEKRLGHFSSVPYCCCTAACRFSGWDKMRETKRELWASDGLRFTTGGFSGFLGTETTVTFFLNSENCAPGRAPSLQRGRRHLRSEAPQLLGRCQRLCPQTPLTRLVSRKPLRGSNRQRQRRLPSRISPPQPQ